jgi:hypothetical protein
MTSELRHTPHQQAIIRLMQFRIIIWAGYVSVMEEARNLYSMFVGELQEGHLTDRKWM